MDYAGAIKIVAGVVGLGMIFFGVRAIYTRIGRFAVLEDDAKDREKNDQAVADVVEAIDVERKERHEELDL